MWSTEASNRELGVLADLGDLRDRSAPRRRGRMGELSRHLPRLRYIAIAPFIEAPEAIGSVEEMSAREPA
jgi:hypothetical protein